MTKPTAAGFVGYLQPALYEGGTRTAPAAQRQSTRPNRPPPPRLAPSVVMFLAPAPPGRVRSRVLLERRPWALRTALAPRRLGRRHGYVTLVM